MLTNTLWTQRKNRERRKNDNGRGRNDGADGGRGPTGPLP